MLELKSLMVEEPRMRSALIAAALAALLPSTAMSQSPPSVPNAAPWDQPFLPPTPAWNGASRALLRDASDPWVTAFEADAEHDFSPNYVDTRAWFDRLDQASDLIRIEQFGVSPEGRPIYAVIASKERPWSGVSWSTPWPRPSSAASIWPARRITGEESDHASAIAASVLNVPGPVVVVRTPGRPATLAYPSAANAAPCS